jgi:hypothetical protein
VNRIERSARVDRWQQHHRPITFVWRWLKFGDDQAGDLVALLATRSGHFPLLLALTTILGLVRNFPRLQRDLLNQHSPNSIIGAQIHDQLGVASFGNASFR